MRDNGIVISTYEDLAKVEVNCLEGCQNCSARSLCTGKDQRNSILSAKNPIKASPGDSVMIEIPEARYNKALIKLFGTLLITSFLGMILGYFSSTFLSLDVSTSSLVGLLLGLVLGLFWIFRTFRKKYLGDLYPVIIDIIQR